MDRPLCTHPGCDRVCWGDEVFCRHHLIEAARPAMFTPATAKAAAPADDGVEIFLPTTTTAPADTTHESE